MSEPSSYLHQMKRLSPKPGDVMSVTVSNPLTHIQREAMFTALNPLAQTLGCRLLILEPGMSVSLHVDPAVQFAEQQKQTSLLTQLVEQQALLIQAMARTYVKLMLSP